jgi:ribosomal protein S18 acetylase RimI-like enzyme
MFSKFFKSISNIFPPSSVNNSELELKSWKERLIFTDSLEENRITISELDNKSYLELYQLIRKNKNDDGFLQMPNSIRKGKQIKEIIEEKSAAHCLIARDKKDEKVIGFIIFRKEGNMGVIDALGVDRDYRCDAKNTNARRVGSSLLFTACNDLFFTNIDSIAVMISDDNAGKFYQKCGFNVYPASDEGDEMFISKDKYIQSESAFILKCLGNQSLSRAFP